jgi:hypothetical protein
LGSTEHCDIGIKRVLTTIRRLIKGKIAADHVPVLAEVPSENLHEIMGKARMRRALTQQIILRGVKVVVVDNFLINVVLHGELLIASRKN